MKPSGPLKRHKPLRSTARLRPRSKSRARQDRESKPGLRQFAETFDRCWHCGERPIQVHHLVGRGAGRDCRENLTSFCADCHLLFTDNRWLPPSGWRGNAKEWGVVVALAYKSLRDPSFYDRAKVLKLWRRADSFISESDVLWVAKDIREGERPVCLR